MIPWFMLLHFVQTWTLLAKVFIFSWTFSKALFMFTPLCKFSKPAHLFEISMCLCLLTCSSFALLRLNLSPSDFCGSCLLTANLSLPFETPDSDQYDIHLPWNFVHIVFSNAVSYISLCDQSGCESSHQGRSSCTYYVLVQEHRAVKRIFLCGNVYYSNTIIFTILM